MALKSFRNFNLWSECLVAELQGLMWMATFLMACSTPTTLIKLLEIKQGEMAKGVEAIC